MKMFCYAVRAGLLVLSSITSLLGQQTQFSHELRFAQYLSDKEAIEEALHVLTRLPAASLSLPQRDSLYYAIGWNAYRIKRLDLAAPTLLRVSDASGFYPKSQFFGHYSQAFLGQTDSAYAALVRLPLTDTLHNELRHLQLAGISLLRRDFGRFAQHQRAFSYGSYALEKEERRMLDYARTMQNVKRKSPFLAGLYSAAVPGLGKWYAGKKRQGIAAFLPILSLGLLTYEGWRKDGVRSARFIGFGTLFTVFYVGNIWGSALSVKIKRDEFRQEYDNKILFDMHIPLRNVFE